MLRHLPPLPTRQRRQSSLLSFSPVRSLCVGLASVQAGIEYEYESLEASLPKKAKKTMFED